MKRLLIFLICLVGCSDIDDNQIKTTNAVQLVNSLTIIEHQNTGLCFMTGWFRDSGTSNGTGGPVVVLIPNHYCGDRDLPSEGNDRLSK